MTKDIHRFSHSRLSAFKSCPKKHHYIYVEQVETAEPTTTIPGKLFHECIELMLSNKDCTPVFKEFSDLCMSGRLELEPDLLEYMVQQYFTYYREEFDKEETLLVEKEFTDNLDDDDTIVMKIDNVFRKDGMLFVRDTKTTEGSLKYTLDDVMYNQQLLLYVPYVEEYIGEKVDAIQIDEVRLAKLQPIPLKKDGSPSVDKKALTLVTYEDYYDCLCSQKKEKNPEYQSILDYLKQRGHPLFKRTTAQLIDESVVQENVQEILKSYQAAKQDIDYRVKSKLCNFCQYKELCDLDYHMPDTASRDMIKEKIK